MNHFRMHVKKDLSWTRGVNERQWCGVKLPMFDSKVYLCLKMRNAKIWIFSGWIIIMLTLLCHGIPGF